jgi:DNA-binding XRE family transcriptional regulator
MPRGRTIDWVRRQQMADLYDRGKSFAEIGHALGLSQEWVRKCLAHHGPNHHKLRCRECEADIISAAATGHQRPLLCRDCVFRWKGLPFAEALRSLRVAAGLTQTALAEAAEMSQTQVALYELGRVEPRWSEAVTLFSVLGAAWVLQSTEGRKRKTRA